MARKFGDIIEGPSGVDPANDSQYTRRGYVLNLLSNAANITGGLLSNARLPAVLSVVRSLTPSAGALSIDASTQGNNIDVSVGANFTQNVPTNGTAGQVLNVTCYASGAYTVTFHASFIRLGSIASTLAIPSGKFARYQLRCTNASGTLTWIVEAAAVGQ